MFSQEKYEKIISETCSQYIANENLGKYSTYGCGGNCDVMFFPSNAQSLKELVQSLSGQDFFVLGNGSDILVADGGFNGAVINTSRLNAIDVKGNLITCECGVKISKLVQTAMENSLGGLEFAVGIPAFVGGAVAMNAGCYNKSVSNYVSFVKSSTGVYNNSECDFGYRTSRFSSSDVIFSVGFILKSWDYTEIENKIEHYKKIRQVKSPNGRSCGSVFKNEDYFAGKLIDEAGLKGYKIGGATVSEKHANFIINNGNATSGDIYRLIKTVQKRVYENCGVQLKEELKYIGDFNAT